MKLALFHLDRLPEVVRDELTQLIARINTVWKGDIQTTVGDAGSASALPATPTGYLTVTIDGTERVIPFYDKS